MHLGAISDNYGDGSNNQPTCDGITLFFFWYAPRCEGFLVWSFQRGITFLWNITPQRLSYGWQDPFPARPTAMNPMFNTAILLLNLGGPLRLRDVRPFLLELFRDRDIIKLGPALLQPLIARAIVASRLKAVQGRYAAIGGGSPILRETAAQAAALRAALRTEGFEGPVRLVFRYAAPRATGVLESLRRQGVTDLVPVTLYPHACHATTGSSLRELERLAPQFGMALRPGVEDFATDPDYLDALEGRIREALASRPGATLVFSAHSLPLKQILGGDPYEREIHATVEALKHRLGPLPGGTQLGYQSKVGPVKWLEPSLGSVLGDLCGRDVVVIPLSFVGEHIETLHELDIEYRELAKTLGIRSWTRMPTPGLHPAFLRCLTRRTLERLRQPLPAAEGWHPLPE